ncbi:MAG: hypothetical protein K2Y01_09525 [Rhabdochlamydiaceae bacterium]|nr:hypothetical protein [Rhabdochlamydiaceae bacterium]
MRLYLGALLALLPALPAIASSGYGINLSLQSPLVQETDAGTIVTATFLITNTTENEETYTVSLDLPPDWISLPFEEPFLSLKPHQTQVQWIAIRVPPQALATSYPIKYRLQGREHPSLIAESEFSILVLSQNRIETLIEQTPKYKMAGEPYTLTVTLINTGNVANDVEIELMDSSQFPLSLDTPLPVHVEPGQRKQIHILVTTPKDLPIFLEHYVTITTQIQGDPSSLRYLSSVVDILPHGEQKKDLYEYLPMETVFGYGMKNKKKQLFVEQYASGFLDDAQKKNIDAFARIPFINEANVDRDLGGLPENAYVHYWDSFFDIYGGDGVYTLTPLTMLNRFGRGASLEISPYPVSLKSLYIQDTSSVPQTAVGGELSYMPTPPLSISASVLQSSFSHKSEKILLTQENAISHSLLGVFNHEKFGEHTGEYGKTGAVFGSSGEDRSYYLYSRASPWKDTWYALQAIYAQPNFVGYYRDTRQLYGSIGFPVVKKLQGSLSYNNISYNLKSNPLEGSSSRNQNIYGGFSYSFPSGLYTALYYNFVHSKDSISKLGYQTHYTSLNGGKSFQHWTLQGIFEYGNYRDFLSSIPERTWQSYQMYAYYQPTARQQYAAYTRIGYAVFSSEIEWARIYGFSSSWSTPHSLKLQFLYEYTDQVHWRNYLSSRIEYTLPNKQVFALQGYVNKQKQQKNVLEFLFSYTIPWGLPLRKKPPKSSLYGKAYIQNPDLQENPYSSLLVHCNGMRTVTDKKGNFEFPQLTPGDYHLWTDSSSEQWVSSQPFPMTVCINSGEQKEIQLTFTHPASLQGEILLVESQKPLENVSLLLESASTQERIFLSSDAQGLFTTSHLSPGRWILKAATDQLPPYHFFEYSEQVLDLFPGENKEILLKVLPVKRELRMIDTDTIQPTTR